MTYVTHATSNAAIAKHLYTISQLLDLDGQEWPANAYRKAASIVEEHPSIVADLSEPNNIPGIGDSTANTIKQFVSTGGSDKLKALSKLYNPQALSMTVVPGIGPKRALALHADGIRNLDELVIAAKNNKLDEKLRDSVLFAIKSQERIPGPVGHILANTIIQSLLDSGAQKVKAAGSIRRGKETVKDVDLICVANGPSKQKVLRRFLGLGRVLLSGEIKSSIQCEVSLGTRRAIVQCDLWFVEKKNWGAALCYATGSKEHNIALRELAKSKGIKINEYGFWSKSGKRVGGRKERELYDLLEIDYVPPELREGSKILSDIPALLKMSDIVGDYHHHSYWSPDADVTYSINALAKAAKKHGLSTVAVTDHSYATSFKKRSLGEFLSECRAAEKSVGVRVLAGVEVDILIDGSLQWPDKDLRKLDIVVAAIHRKHSENVEQRLVSAIRHPWVDVIAHPTGRLFGRRDIPQASWAEVFRQAAKHKVAMELNGSTDRLDLPSDLSILALEKGCKFTLSSDSHAKGILDANLQNALTIARRSGISSKNLYRPAN